MRRLLSVIALLFFILSATAQQTTTKANYQLASRFSPKRLEKMVFSTSVDPHWLKLSDRFWYEYETPNGKNWYIVDPVKGEKKVAPRPVNSMLDLSLIESLGFRPPDWRDTLEAYLRQHNFSN